jgi:hypothetical protein
MDSNQYIDVFPNKILLSKLNDQNFHEARVTLTNLTTKFVVFKVYINKKTIYSATPSTGYIGPKECIMVNLKRLNKVFDNII